MMVKRKTKGFLALIVFVVLIGGSVVLFSGLKDFDISHAKVTNLTFTSSNNTLTGSLVLPNNVPSPPIVLIVHGDGPQNRFSDSNYLPLINVLLEDGIGVFTWDKPGIGESTGAWLQQSMQDRSDEVRAAYAKIQSLPELKNSPIGLLGFSQAGWVLPITDNEIQPAFTVIIGGAVDWRRQGAYFTKRRLEAEGLPPEKVSQEVAANLKDTDAVFGNPETATPGQRPKMNPDRFDFIVRNYSSDASPYLASMQGPVLALWGADDKNVDPIYNQSIYNQHLQKDKDQQTAIIKNASHGLLNAKWFDYQLSSEWPLWKKGVFMLMGRHAYASRALDTIGMWIQKETQKQAN